MNVFLKAISGVIILLIASIVLNKNGKDFALLLTLYACISLGAVVFDYIEPIVTFMNKLRSIGDLDGAMVQLILKAVAVCVLAEIVGVISTDAGNAAVAKMVHLLSAIVIIGMSVPLFTQFLDLLDDILILQ